MHRSGTSALSGVLSLLDVYLGSDLMKPTQENPKGYFENNALYRVNEKLLAQMGSSWSDMFYTEAKLDKAIDLTPLKETIRKEFGCSQLFAIKDPRLAYLFPLYRRALEEMGITIKVVLPYRNPFEVASSLKKRNGFSAERGMLLWAYHFLLAEKHSRDFPRAFVSFDELVADPEGVVGHISDGISIDLRSRYKLAQDEIARFLEPGLKHHNISMDNLSGKTPKVVKEILALKGGFGAQSALIRMDELRSELSDYQALFYNDDVVDAYDALQTKEGELTQAKQSLTQTQSALQTKEGELTQTRESLQTKEGELAQIKQSLIQAQTALQTKENKLTQTRESLQIKEGELAQIKQSLNAQVAEKDDLSNEIALLHGSRSWRYTRPIRKLAKRLKGN
jgi:hypothetical protein